MRYALFASGAVEAAFIALIALSSGCAGEAPRAPPPMHPIAEQRAADVIGRAFRERTVKTERNRVVHVGHDKEIRLEVAAADRRYGVAYLTTADVTALGDAIPPRPEGTDALMVVRGEKGARILVLYQSDYVEDDLRGEEHTTTSIAAERKLERDVRDFLYKAAQQGWP